VRISNIGSHTTVDEEEDRSTEEEEEARTTIDDEFTTTTTTTTGEAEEEEEEVRSTIDDGLYTTAAIYGTLSEEGDNFDVNDEENDDFDFLQGPTLHDDDNYWLLQQQAEEMNAQSEDGDYPTAANW